MVLFKTFSVPAFFTCSFFRSFCSSEEGRCQKWREQHRSAVNIKSCGWHFRPLSSSRKDCTILAGICVQLDIASTHASGFFVDQNTLPYLCAVIGWWTISIENLDLNMNARRQQQPDRIFPSLGNGSIIALEEIITPWWETFSPRRDHCRVSTASNMKLSAVFPSHHVKTDFRTLLSLLWCWKLIPPYISPVLRRLRSVPLLASLLLRDQLVKAFLFRFESLDICSFQVNWRSERHFCSLHIGKL